MNTILGTSVVGPRGKTSRKDKRDSLITKFRLFTCYVARLLVTPELRSHSDQNSRAKDRCALRSPRTTDISDLAIWTLAVLYSYYINLFSASRPQIMRSHYDHKWYLGSHIALYGRHQCSISTWIWKAEISLYLIGRVSGRRCMIFQPDKSK